MANPLLTNKAVSCYQIQSVQKSQRYQIGAKCCVLIILIILQNVFE